MSKTHVSENQDDVDSFLDAFIAGKKTKPVVAKTSDGVDVFGGSEEKKKSLLHRIMAYLFPSMRLHS